MVQSSHEALLNSTSLTAAQQAELQDILAAHFATLPADTQANLKALAANAALGDGAAVAEFQRALIVHWPLPHWPFPPIYLEDTNGSDRSVAIGLIVIGIGLMLL